MLRCFQHLSLPHLATGQCLWATTRTPVMRPLRSSRTRSSPLNSPAPRRDRDRTVSRRSKPSSRTTLNGEQPYRQDLLQPQDVMSRHPGAKHRRRYELLGGISLLVPEYLYPLSDALPFMNYRIIMTCFRTCSSRHLAVKLAWRHCTPLTRCPTRLAKSFVPRYFGRSAQSIHHLDDGPQPG